MIHVPTKMSAHPHHPTPVWSNWATTLRSHFEDGTRGWEVSFGLGQRAKPTGGLVAPLGTGTASDKCLKSEDWALECAADQLHFLASSRSAGSLHNTIILQ